MNGLYGGGVFEIPSDGMTFGVVGSGKLGMAFISALLKQKSLGWVLCRTEETAMQISEQFDWNVTAVANMAYITDLADVIIIAVPDSEIASIADSFARHFGSQLNDKVVMHCSGVFGREQLAICNIAGAVTIAAHPFQTFSNNSDIAFRGIYWGVECDENDREIASAIVHRFGGQPQFLSAFTQNHRGLYHAAAVFASNFVVAAIASAKETAIAAGITPAEFLLPIISTATESALQALDDDSIPLTGPAARGDIDTISRHIEQFAEVAPHLGFEYSLMSRSVVESAKNNGLITNDKYNLLCSMLDEAITALRPQE